VSDPAPRGWRRVVVDTSPLRHTAYRRLWASTVVTTVGAQLTAVAVPKQVYDDTGSSAYVGLAGAVALVPLVVFALWGGSIADAVDRRKMLLATNTGIALTSLGLFVQAALGVRSVVAVLVLLFVQQACFGLNSPARGAAVPRLVPAAELPAANALTSTVFGLGSVIGPLLAGALIPLTGLPTLYLVDTLALVITLYAVWRLPSMPPLPTTSGEKVRAGVGAVAEGLRHIALQPILLVSFLADIIAMVLGMPRALFPELAQRVYGDPAGGGLALGLLYAAIPAGSFVVGLVSGSFTRIRRQGAAVAVSVGVWGLAIVGFGLAPTLPVAVAFLAIGGAADLVSMVFRSAILATAVTDELRGRMQGVFFVVVAGGPRLADVLHGTVGGLLGARAATTAGGLAVVVAISLLVVRLPSFWRYRSADPAHR
jgi:MFS family permease